MKYPRIADLSKVTTKNVNKVPFKKKLLIVKFCIREYLHLVDGNGNYLLTGGNNERDHCLIFFKF